MAGRSRQKRFNEFVRQLYVLQDAESLRERIAAGLLDVLDGDNVIVNELLARKPLTCRSFVTRHACVSADFPAWFVDRAQEIPLEDYSLDPNHYGTKVLSSVISRRNLRRTAYYNEVLRPEAVADVFGVEIGRPRTVLTGVAVTRSAQGCPQQDAQALTDLVPHLEQAVSNSLQFSLLTSPALLLGGIESGLDAGLAMLNEDGGLIHCSEGTQKMIQRYFPNASQPVNRLPEELKKWVGREIQSRREGRANPPLRKMRGANVLEFSLSEEPDGGRLLLVVREKKAPVNLTSFGLTRREAEVLHWIAEGKTNEEIALILDVSFFTIKAQVRSLFRRLGVETRTAAAAMLMRKEPEA